MFLFSTIIYYDESPVGYDVYREEDIFQLKPAIDSHCDFQPPIITAIYLNQVWMIDGTENDEIIEQVKKIIELNQLISALNVAS
jgi:hypothetical protein